jgi:hypothetical protein
MHWCTAVDGTRAPGWTMPLPQLRPWPIAPCHMHVARLRPCSSFGTTPSQPHIPSPCPTLTSTDTLAHCKAKPDAWWSCSWSTELMSRPQVPTCSLLPGPGEGRKPVAMQDQRHARSTTCKIMSQGMSRNSNRLPYALCEEACCTQGGLQNYTGLLHHSCERFQTT